LACSSAPDCGSFCFCNNPDNMGGQCARNGLPC
jgi:hypothetical protein